MALLNLGSTDPSLRTAAYNLLCALSGLFDFKIEGQLLETEGKFFKLIFTFCNGIFFRVAYSGEQYNFYQIDIGEVGRQRTAFDVGIFGRMHSRSVFFFLFIGFLKYFFFLGFRQSSIELKHLCLEYMTPWLSNLPRFCKLIGDDVKRQKVSVILDRLVTMTIEEFEVLFLSQKLCCSYFLISDVSIDSSKNLGKYGPRFGITGFNFGLFHQSESIFYLLPICICHIFLFSAQYNRRIGIVGRR